MKGELSGMLIYSCRALLKYKSKHMDSNPTILTKMSEFIQKCVISCVISHKQKTY